MVNWTFRQALFTIKSPPSIPTSVLESSTGLRLEDIRFAEICTTLRMHTVSLMLLERLIADMAESDYSHSTAILLIFVTDAKPKDIERVGIGLVVCQCSGPLAVISSTQQFISYIHDVLKQERASCKLTFRTCVILLGNYSGHMAFATDLPFCLAYLVECLEKKDPCAMMIWNPDNHLVAFMGNDMVVHQLLTQDCLECEYERTSCGGCLIIPRGM